MKGNNKTTFEDKNKRHDLVHGLPKHKTILKNEKKNGTGYSFQKKKRCFLLSAGNTQKN